MAWYLRSSSHPRSSFTGSALFLSTPVLRHHFQDRDPSLGPALFSDFSASLSACNPFTLEACEVFPHPKNPAPFSYAPFQGLSGKCFLFPSLPNFFTESVAFCCLFDCKLALPLCSVLFKVSLHHPTAALLTGAKVSVAKFIELFQRGSTPHTWRSSLVLFKMLSPNQEVFHQCLLKQTGTCFQERTVSIIKFAERSVCVGQMRATGLKKKRLLAGSEGSLRRAGRCVAVLCGDGPGGAVVTLPYRCCAHVLCRSRTAGVWHRREEARSTRYWRHERHFESLRLRKPWCVCGQGGLTCSSPRTERV